MRKIAKILILISGISFLLLSGILDSDISQSYAATTTKDSDPKPAPEFKLKDINGKTVKLSDYKGKVVLLNFWATWCGPCKMEIPDFVELQKTYQKQGLVIIGVSVDESGAKVVKPFYQKNKMNYPVLLTDNKIEENYGGIYGIPTSFLIDRNGNIVKKYIGYRKKADWETDVKSVLAVKL